MSEFLPLRFQLLVDFRELSGAGTDLRFKLFYPVHDVVMRTDPGLLLSVLRNLIDNAFKYTEHGGILVGFRRRGRGGIIQVWDTGIGIEAKYGDQIFDECFQVGNPLRDRTKGLGIGLAIVRRTARLLGGEVTYRSRPGRGSVFEVYLPEIAGDRDATTQAAPTLSGAADEDYSLLRGWRVVVIEDDCGTSNGFAMKAVVQGGDVIEALRDRAVQLAVERGWIVVLKGHRTLLTDGRELYARMHDGRLFNILRDPTQPLLVIGGEQRWKKLASRVRPKKARPARTKAATIDDEH